jgi:hypothetical protein
MAASHMKRTYILIGDDWMERKRDKRRRNHYVMADIQPYKSMIDGRMITSRSQHRAHLKAHNCVEVGNENPTKHRQAPPPDRSRLERIKWEVNNNMTNEQADRVLRQIRTELNFTNPHRRG